MLSIRSYSSLLSSSLGAFSITTPVSSWQKAPSFLSSGFCRNDWSFRFFTMNSMRICCSGSPNWLKKKPGLKPKVSQQFLEKP